ncbi:MAG: tyrosine-type recombinase/integrase [Gemmatimonadales bacterium]
MSSKIDAWLDHLAYRNRSPKTVRNYGVWVRSVAEHAGKTPDDLVAEDVKRFCRVRGHKPRTVSQVAAAVRSWLRWLGRAEEAERVALPTIRDGEMLPLLTEDEIGRVLAAAKGCPRDYAILSLFIHSGICLGELVRLNRDDVFEVDLGGGRRLGAVRVTRGKGGRWRTVPTTPATLAAVRRYWAQRSDRQPAAFVRLDRPGARLDEAGVQGVIEKYVKRAGIGKPIHGPHALRRTCTTACYNRGMRESAINRLLGHARGKHTWDVLRRYLKVFDPRLFEEYYQAWVGGGRQDRRINVVVIQPIVVCLGEGAA